MHWTCPVCRHDNVDVIVCATCDHELTQQELRRLELRRKFAWLSTLHLGAGTGRDPTWVRRLGGFAGWATFLLILVSLVPGFSGLAYLRSDADPYAMRPGCEAPDDCRRERGISAASVLVTESRGVFGVLTSWRLEQMASVTVYQDLEGALDGLTVVFDQDRNYGISQSGRVVAVEIESDGGRRVAGELDWSSAVADGDNGRVTIGILSASAPGLWSIEGDEVRIPGREAGALEVSRVEGPVSQALGGPLAQLLLLALLVGVAVRYVGPHAGGAIAANSAMAMLAVVLAEGTRDLIARTAGRMAVNDEYSAIVGALIIGLAVAVTAGIPLLLRRRLRRRFDRRDEEGQLVLAGPSRTAGLVAFPLVVLLGLGVADQVLGALLLGIEL